MTSAQSLPPAVVASAADAAQRAAQRAAVEVGTASTMAELRAVSALFASVWGRTSEGVPVGSELMRGLTHAGGCVTFATDSTGTIVGAAVLTPAAPPGSTYSLIAAAAPGATNRGIGQAVKLAQRAWALDHGYTTMSWTFDPLVSRNAHLNLARLGGYADRYEIAFYGRMSDAINGDDDSDRLVITWLLGSPATAAAAEDAPSDRQIPATTGEPLRDGPDGAPMAQRAGSDVWIRVPADIVALRRTDPDLARRWRFAVREAFLAALDEGRAATYATRDGWYRLSPADRVAEVGR